MGSLHELLAIDHRQALEFFVVRLQDVAEPTIDRDELVYNASVLAHYAQVPIQHAADVPAPANLSVVFDRFVLDPTLLAGGPMMETAVAQCLLLAGFLRTRCVTGTTSAGMPSWARASSAALLSTNALRSRLGCSLLSADASSPGGDATHS